MKLNLKLTKPKKSDKTKVKSPPVNTLGANAPKTTKPDSKLYPANAPQTQFSQGVTSVKDIIAPGAVEVDFNPTVAAISPA